MASSNSFRIARVVSRIYLAKGGPAPEGEEEGDTKKKKGPPPMWNEFMKEKYNGGKKKVRNTNPDTKDTVQQVTVNTLMRNDDGFKKKIYREYSEWMKKQKKGPKKTPAKKPPASSSFTNPSGWKMDAQKISKMMETFDKDFDGFKDLEADLQKFDFAKGINELQSIDRIKNSPYGNNTPANLAVEREGLERMSKAEQFLHVKGDEIGKTFKKWLMEKHGNLYGYHRTVLNSWRGSSTSPEAVDLLKMLKKLGVPGKLHIHGEDEEKDPPDPDPELKEWFEVQYAFTQAVLKKLGIKEVTCYRGVKNQLPTSGNDVSLQTRGASSWTSNLAVGKDFAFSSHDDSSGVVEVKVPIENIGFCCITDPDFGRDSSFSESEYVVLGGSSLTGKIMEREEGGKKMAASKKIELDEENEDWLKQNRKKDKGKKDKDKGKGKTKKKASMTSRIASVYLA